MSFFWSNTPNGDNMLKGVPGDPTNPVRLDDSLIVTILYTSPKAQRDFQRVFPSLLPAEQSRLTDLLAKHPWALTLIDSPFVVADQVQHVLAVQGVYTSGPQDDNH